MRAKKRDRNNKNIHTYVEAAAKIYWGRESTRGRGGNQSAGKKMEISGALLIRERWVTQMVRIWSPNAKIGEDKVNSVTLGGSSPEFFGKKLHREMKSTGVSDACPFVHPLTPSRGTMTCKTCARSSSFFNCARYIMRDVHCEINGPSIAAMPFRI